MMFWLVLTAIFTGCLSQGPDKTETVSGTSGTLMSTGYPSSYLANTKHRWVINAPPGMSISLHFSNPFSLESSALGGACYDSLDVYDSVPPPSKRCNTNAHPTRNYCGTAVPNDYLTYGNTVVVEFCTDYSTQWEGFSIQWTAVKIATTPRPTPPSRACGMPSPRYPQDIPIVDGTVQGRNKIVGGTHAPPHSWPWAAALFTGSHSKYQFCGGSLIGHNWLLTAAHCFYGVSQSSLYRYRVKLGADVKQANSGDSSLPNESTQQVCNITAYYQHPQYNHGAHTYDMTLLRLNCTVEYTDAIKPVCLPQSSENRPYPGEEVITIGWGTTSYGGSDSDVLMEVVLQAISNDQCNDEYSGRITDTMFCLETPHKDSCQGDSGGGVFSLKNGIWEVVGIVSWGRGCAEPGYGGVYGKVIPMVDWLKNTTGLS